MSSQNILTRQQRQLPPHTDDSLKATCPDNSHGMGFSFHPPHTSAPSGQARVPFFGVNLHFMVQMSHSGTPGFLTELTSYQVCVDVCLSPLLSR